jgi:hypothetical protein
MSSVKKNATISFHQDLSHYEVKTGKKIQSRCLISKLVTRAWIRVHAHEQEY